MTQHSTRLNPRVEIVDDAKGPFGDPEAWPGAIEAFLDVADRHAWALAVIGCSERGATVFNRVGGLDALELGDEAVVSVSGFSLQGRPRISTRFSNFASGLVRA
jgi:lysylphosphatidylglycerol synthetase-like protein (DUF2156 family)